MSTVQAVNTFGTVYEQQKCHFASACVAVFPSMPMKPVIGVILTPSANNFA